MSSQAENVIDICGGFHAVAEICGRSVVQVRRWTYPKKRGGTGGLIPADCQQILMGYAKAKKLGLAPAHFFPEHEEDAAA